MSERMLREYSAGLKLKNSSMTYIESCVKTTPSRRRAWSSGVVLRRNICMRPIVVAGANDTYFSFAKLKANGGAVDFMLAVGYTKSFGYHSKIFTGILTFPPPVMIEEAAPSPLNSVKPWVVVLVVLLFMLIVVILCVFRNCLFKNVQHFNQCCRCCLHQRTNKKHAPAVATVDVEMSANPATIIQSPNPLDEFRFNHRIDHQVVEMAKRTSTRKTVPAVAMADKMADIQRRSADHQVVLVDTLFGAGTVVQTRDDGTQVIHLNWKLAGGSIAVMYLPKTQGPNARKKKSLKNRSYSGASPALLCLFCFCSIFCNGSMFCNAHNWLNNPASRASKTSTVTPCPPADLTRPAHMQVGMDQGFEVEFMSGHSYTNTYFAIIRHEDENQLKYHKDAMFERYIADAPEGATVPAPERTHVSCVCQPVFLVFDCWSFGVHVFLFDL